MITAISLFAGVGGFDLALERNGVSVVASVEIDKNARKILERHFPKSKIFNDVTEVTGEQLREAGFIAPSRIPRRAICTASGTPMCSSPVMPAAATPWISSGMKCTTSAAPRCA